MGCSAILFQAKNTSFEGYLDGRCAIIYAEFAEDVNEVGFNGGGADMEAFANFGVALALGYSIQYFDFAAAKAFSGRVAHPSH